MEEMRIHFKDFKIRGKARFNGSGWEACVWFDPNDTKVIADHKQEKGFFFIFRLEPLVPAKYSHCRSVLIHGDNMVLVHNKCNRDISAVYIKNMIEHNIGYLGKGKWERFDGEESFRERVGYWVGYLPRDSREEAIKMIRPFSIRYLSERNAIIGEFGREHGIRL